MDECQDDDAYESIEETEPVLKKRATEKNRVTSPSRHTSKTSENVPLQSSYLRPRKLLMISLACNVIVVGVWFGFHMLMELSSDRCLSNVNVTALNSSLTEAVIGQSAAMQQLFSAIDKYVQNASVACLSRFEGSGVRPLVVAIHGGSGTGKTYIVDLLANHFGMQCSRHFIVPLHFSSIHNKSRNAVYRNQIITAMQIPALGGSCLLRLLVLEEADDIPKGVLSGLVTASLTWSKAYVPTVVLLTSSLGSRLVFDYIVSSEQSRSEIQQTTLSRLVTEAAVAANTSWGDTVARGNLVRRSIYLLPLESQHVQQCIENSLKARGFKRKDWVETILKHSSFVDGRLKKFAQYGCKTVEADSTYWTGA